MLVTLTVLIRCN